MLQVYSASWCSACSAVKKFLVEHKIPFKERDIEMDQDAYDDMVRLKLRSIPVVYLDDNNFIVGANMPQILELAGKVS